MDGADGVDRVGLGRGLVLAVAQHPGEAQRDAAGIARAASARRRRRPRRPARAARARPSRESSTASAPSRSVCQRSIASVSPLNVLPEHHEPAGPGRARRGAGWTASRCGARGPTRPRARPGRACAAASPSASRRRAGPASYGVVERLDHHALVPAVQRRRERGRRLGHRPGDDPRHPQRLRAPARPAPPPARRPGASSRSAPSRCSRSNSTGVSGDRPQPGRVAAAADPRRGHLERLRPAVRPQRDRLAVEHRARSPAAPAPPRPPPAPGAVMSSSERVKTRHVGAAAVDLDAGAVELPLDRRRGADLGQRGVHAVARSARASAAPAGRPRAGTPPAPPPRRPAPPPRPRPRSPRSITARRTSLTGTPAACATASTITPSSAPWRSSPTSSCRRNRCSGAVARANRSAEQRPPGRLRPGPGLPADLLERRVDLADPQARRLGAGGGTSRSVAQPTPICRWRSSPDRNATAAAASSGVGPAQRRRRAARPCPAARTVAATAADVSARSRSSTVMPAKLARRLRRSGTAPSHIRRRAASSAAGVPVMQLAPDRPGITAPTKSLSAMDRHQTTRTEIIWPSRTPRAHGQTERGRSQPGSGSHR